MVSLMTGLLLVWCQATTFFAYTVRDSESGCMDRNSPLLNTDESHTQQQVRAAGKLVCERHVYQEFSVPIFADCAVGHVLSIGLCGCLFLFGTPSLALGVGREALHPPSSAASSSTWMATSEEEGLHLRPSSSQQRRVHRSWGDCTSRLPSSHLGELPRGREDCTSSRLPTMSMISLPTPCAAPRSRKRLRQRSTLTLLSVSKVANELVKGFPKIIDGSAQPDYEK